MKINKGKRKWKMNKVRIVTYNVHCWETIDNKENFSKICEDIKTINGDIICLQEVLFGDMKLNKKSYQDMLSEFNNMGYIYHIENYCCKFKSSIYGNLIISKLPFKSKKTGILYKGLSKVKRGYCLIELENPNIWICCLHLDVFDENYLDKPYKNFLLRELQLAELLSLLPTDNVILAGDFNTILESDYSFTKLNDILLTDKNRGILTDTKTLKQLINLDYNTSFNIINKSPPDSTVWSSRVVDFIFLSKSLSKFLLNTDCIPTSSSDHYPVYIDILIT